MIKPMYSYRDEKVGFTNVFLETNDGVAKRGFGYGLSSSGGIAGFCPTDFSLYHVADFDTETGITTPCSPLVMIASGGEFSALD